MANKINPDGCQAGQENTKKVTKKSSKTKNDWTLQLLGKHDLDFGRFLVETQRLLFQGNQFE